MSTLEITVDGTTQVLQLGSLNPAVNAQINQAVTNGAASATAAEGSATAASGSASAAATSASNASSSASAASTSAGSASASATASATSATASATSATVSANAYSAIANGTATSAGALTGTETAPTSRGAGLLQTIWNTVAAFVLSTYKGFTQFGTGAAQRTTTAKLGDYCVTAEDYFLASDADSTGMIQRAINAVSAAGGGVIKLLKPMYRAQGLILQSGVILMGAARDATVIMASNGWNATSVIDTYNFDFYKLTAGNPTDANTPNACGLVNLVLDGNHSNFSGTPSVTAGYVARLAAERLVILIT